MPTADRDRRPLVLLLTANVISVTGNMLTLVAVPWFVLQTTGSAAHAGLVAFASTLPVAVAALLGGPLIDRLGQTVSSVVSDTVCMLAVGAIPVLHMAGALSYGALLALVAVAGLFHAPGETAREVLMPRLAEVAGTTVARASSGYEGASRGARMLGAPLAGVLIAAVGAADVLLVDAASFAASALLVGFGARAHGMPRRGGAEPGRQGYAAQLREGYGYLVGARLLFAVVLMVMVTNALDQAWSAVLLPVDAREHLGGAAAIGLVSGTTGGAALIGSLLYGAYGQRLPRRGLFIGAFLVAGFPRTAVAAFVPGLAPLIAVTAVCGVAAGVLNPIIGTEMVRLVPERLRSRVFGAVTSGCLMAMPLGGLAAGYLVQYAGLRQTLAAVSAAYLLTTLSPLVLPAFRDWSGPARQAASASAGGRLLPGGEGAERGQRAVQGLDGDQAQA
ncbi:MAG: MFS transporter [Streptomyces sp.]|nr:MFS transporter [Streptomyces sp.]